MPNPNTTRKTAKKTTKKTATKKAAKSRATKPRSDTGKFAAIEAKVENGAPAPGPTSDAVSAVETTYFRSPVSGDAPRADGNVVDVPAPVIDSVPVVQPDIVVSRYDAAPDHALDERVAGAQEMVEEAVEQGVENVTVIDPESGEILAAARDGEIVDPATLTPEQGAESDKAIASEPEPMYGPENPCENKACDICYESVPASSDPESGETQSVPAPGVREQASAFFARVWTFLVNLWNYQGPQGSLHEGLHVTRVTVVVLALVSGIVAASALL